MKKLIASMLLISAYGYASNVAVVDSGTDFRHNLLKDKAWVNSGETPNNMDDDHNGKIDDLHGWNFENNSVKFYDPTGLEKLHPAVFKTMEAIGRIDVKAATAEDKALIEKIKALPQAQKEKFLNQLNWYGQHAHGTHCSGIVANNKYAKIMSGKVFQDSPTPDSPEVSFAKQFGFWDSALDMFKQLISIPALAMQRDKLYADFAKEFNGKFSNVSAYLGEKNLEVTNMSLGVPIPDIANEILSKISISYMATKSKDQLSKESFRIYKHFEKGGYEWLKKSPSNLFVIAAGNSSMDNDKFPDFPGNLKAENLITVAATNGYKEIADFSNFGATTVHVAAPGVSVMSTVPHADNRNMMLPMSGTSMAAPFVSMVSSGIKDVNANLKPAQVKAILMGTVDVKSWLKGKVVTSGIVNANRAVTAAKLAKTLSVEAAIVEARKQVADMPEVGAVVPGTRGVRVQISKDMSDFAKKFKF